MSVTSTRLYAINCDKDDCTASHSDPSSHSALAARIASGRDGWAYGRKQGPHGSKGNHYKDVDYCPEHASEAVPS